jgi:hypothetical protein
MPYWPVERSEHPGERIECPALWTHGESLHRENEEARGPDEQQGPRAKPAGEPRHEKRCSDRQHRAYGQQPNPAVVQPL